MANQQVNKILESDEKDLVILIYLARKVFPKKKQRQWWLANSEFTEHDLDLILSMADLFGPAAKKSKKFDKCRAHLKCYRSNSDAQIDGADSPVTYSGLRDLVKRIRDFAAFWESSSNGYLSNQLPSDIMESDEKDPFILFYLGRKVFRKTPDYENQRQWWLANSEFTEYDLDLISSMTELFHPLDALEEDNYCVHMDRYFSNSDDQIDGADSAVTYSGLRDLVRRIRGSAAFRESLGNLN
ncbi:hypothetical protein POM88_033219 [Heracleum sosnowskyi]|uniref:Uncharacterized protein n=1 Tax=Heracleum sosnowskyi TaxID=360622 RepID=A0AAD8MKT7_9APIA|nr:hypothetical protein POM88_033219 [Heracleum sosnowskyi]